MRGEISDVGGMADHAGAFAPGVQLECRRLHAEACGRLRREVELHLVRRAGAGRGQGAGEAELDRAVQVAAEDALDLRMARDDLASASRPSSPISSMWSISVGKGG